VFHLATFLGIAALVIVTPGPDTALTIRNTLLGGRTGGVFTAIGVAIGQAVWTLATSAGVAAILLAWSPAFTAIRLAGALYLIVLGAQALHAAWRGDAPAAGPAPAATAQAPVRALQQGVLSNLGNPKMPIFFMSLLPQFVESGAPRFASLLALGLVFCAMTLVWLTVYALIVASAGRWLRGRRARRALAGATGVALVGFGVRLATEHR
jgi:threonine/homoserine/homoserine lactone efflux protein